MVWCPGSVLVISGPLHHACKNDPGSSNRFKAHGLFEAPLMHGVYRKWIGLKLKSGCWLSDLPPYLTDSPLSKWRHDDISCHEAWSMCPAMPLRDVTDFPKPQGRMAVFLSQPEGINLHHAYISNNLLTSQVSFLAQSSLQSSCWSKSPVNSFVTWCGFKASWGLMNPKKYSKWLHKTCLYYSKCPTFWINFNTVRYVPYLKMKVLAIISSLGVTLITNPHPATCTKTSSKMSFPHSNRHLLWGTMRSP